MKKDILRFIVIAIALISISLQGISQFPFFKDGDQIIYPSGSRNGAALWDQFYPLAGGYNQSCLFTDPESADFTNIAAEDFVVPSGSTWGIRYIDVAGTYLEWKGVHIEGFNIYFYNNDDGKPGSIIHSIENYNYFNVFPIEITYFEAFRFQIMLPSVITFPSGHYWFSVQAICDFNETSPWAWLSYYFHCDPVEYEYHWKNPNDGYGTGFTDWTPASTFAFINTNLSFALYADGEDNDLAMISIDEPNTSSSLGSNETITVTIKNEGINTAAGFQVSYSINGGNTVTEWPSITLDPNQVLQHTFNTPIDFSEPGSYEITASITLAGDPIPGNNTASRTIHNPGIVYVMPSTGTQTITTCGASFTDSGGYDGNAGQNDNAVTTIYPANPGDRVRLTFVEFDAGYGGFRVYDGTSTDAPLLGNWVGTNSPRVLTALNPDGALTIHYTGNNSWEDVPGWLAFISCVTPVDDDFAILSLTSSLETVFEGNTTILYAKIQNLGFQSQQKSVTFSANGNVIGMVTTRTLNTGETEIVNLDWTPTVHGMYTIEASLPGDQGPEPNNSMSFEIFVYPLNAFFEDFEGATFPPQDWISGIGWNQYPGGYNSEFCAMNFCPKGVFDTLISPRIIVEENAILTYYAFSVDYWPGGLTIIWKEEGTDEWIVLQTPAIKYGQYSKFTVDMSAFAGLIGKLGFVAHATDPFNWVGLIQLDHILGQNIYYHYDDFDLRFKSFDGDVLYCLGENSEFSFTIRNTGLQTIPDAGYRVKLMVDGQSPIEVFSIPGEQIALNEEKTYNLSYIFPEIGVYHMYAVVDLEGDQNPANNTSNLRVLSGLPANSVIKELGEKVFISDYPIAMQHNYSLSETLYASEIIGQQGVIFGLTWDYLFENDSPDLPVRVWVGLTDLTDLSNAWITADNLTPVFDGKLNLIDGEQTVYIPFSTPINYDDPSKNLVVMVQKNAMTPAANQEFYAHWRPYLSSRLAIGNSTPLNPFNPPGGDISRITPSTRFIFNHNLGSAEGIVSEPDGSPIEGASVTVGQLNIATTSNADGSYELPYIPAGTYPATASKSGYSAVTNPLTVITGNTTTLNFVLGEQALVSVTGYVTGIDNPGAGIENAIITLTGSIHTYSILSGEGGTFILEYVYSQTTYQIIIEADGYAAYSAPVVITSTDVDLGEIVLNESMLIPFVIMAKPVAGSMEISWNTPASFSQQVLVFDDGGYESGWAGKTGEEVWFGNYIPFDEPATINGFDFFWAEYSSATTPQPLRVDIFDAEFNLVVSSESFMSGMDQWIYVEVPNITLLGDHYAMIYWNNTPAQSGYLGWDANDAPTEYARYRYAGGDITPLSNISGEKGAFMIRPHIMSESGAPLTGRTLTGYDIRFGKLNDIGNAENWPKLNPVILNGNVFNDYSWPPGTNDRYIYAIQAFYTTGESEFSFSNVINYVGVGKETAEANNFAIYPNPSEEYITIRNASGAYALLFGTDGLLKRRIFVNGNEFRINLNGIAAGSYLLVIYSDIGIKQQKLIIK